MNKNSLPRKHKVIGTVIKANGRTVGQVYNGVFVKDVSSHKHFLHTPEAIAYTIETLHAAQRAGAEFCEVLDTDTGIRYRASIAKIFDMGKPFNYGWGDQIYLTLQNWLQTVDPEVISHSDAQEYSDSDGTNDIMPLYYKSNAPTGITVNGVKQLSLWGRR